MPIAEQEPEAMLAAHGHVDVVLSNDYVPPEALGEFNIQLNAIGPNWFENPTYFPPGLWERDADLRALVAQEVPLQRLGQEHEMGALIAFLASGRATPVTGQFFGFTGGWLP
jgi:3-oxoacyl-[acyl-carrier protein] reductase